MPCPGHDRRSTGREFENENQFDLGTVPLHRRRSPQSCNTTFIQQALTLPDDALAAAAASYGVGTDWKLPVGIFGGSRARPTRTGTDEGGRRDRPGRGADEPGRSWRWSPPGIASGKPAAPVEVVGADARRAGAAAGPASRCSTRSGR